MNRLGRAAANTPHCKRTHTDPTQRPKQILYINSARKNVHNKSHILRTAMQNTQAAKHPTSTDSVEPFSNQHAGGQTNVSSRSLFIHKQQRDTNASQSDCKIREHTYERQVDATEYYTYQWREDSSTASTMLSPAPSISLSSLSLSSAWAANVSSSSEDEP